MKLPPIYSFRISLEGLTSVDAWSKILVKWSEMEQNGGGERMLIGKYTNALDTKGRVFVPAAFRGDLGERFVLTRGSEEKSLYIYPENEWEKFVEKLQQLPTSKKNSRMIIRHFCANATNCTMDSQGRFLIPQELRDKAELQRDVAFIGTVNRIEVWSAENVSDTEVGDIGELLESLDIDF